MIVADDWNAGTVDDAFEDEIESYIGLARCSVKERCIEEVSKSTEYNSYGSDAPFVPG